MVRFFKGVHERRIGVAFPDQQAERRFSLLAGAASHRQRQDSQNDCASLHTVTRFRSIHILLRAEFRRTVADAACSDSFRYCASAR